LDDDVDAATEARPAATGVADLGDAADLARGTAHRVVAALFTIIMGITVPLAATSFTDRGGARLGRREVRAFVGGSLYGFEPVALPRATRRAKSRKTFKIKK